MCCRTLQRSCCGVNCAPSEELRSQTSVHARAAESPACQTGLPLSDGFLPRLCCLGPCLQLQPGPAFPDIATSTTRVLPERPGAACRARSPGGGARARPCATWDKALHMVGQNTKPGRGAALPPSRGGLAFTGLFFFPGFLRYSTISLVTPGCLRCGCQTLGFL